MKKLLLLTTSLFTFFTYAQEDTTIYTTVEQTAQFPQGIECFFDYLVQNGNFTTEGKIITQFVIEKNGTLTEVRIIRGIDEDSDCEAIRLLNKSPKWIPAKQNGQTVRQIFVLPIKIIK